VRPRPVPDLTQPVNQHRRGLVSCCDEAKAANDARVRTELFSRMLPHEGHVRDERCLLGSSRITGTSSCGLVHQTLRNDRFAVSRIARCDPAFCLMFLPGFSAVVTPAGDFAVTPGECLLCRFLRSYEFTKAFRPGHWRQKVR
jgi:hypothetical protein